MNAQTARAVAESDRREMISTEHPDRPSSRQVLPTFGREAVFGCRFSPPRARSRAFCNSPRIRDDHPDVASVPGDVLAGQHQRCERDGGQGEHEHAGTDPHVDGEGGKTRCEARVLALQALPDDGRGPGGRGIARARSHSPALGHSRSGGPGGPVYGRRRRPIQRAMNSSSPAVWLRTMSSTGLDTTTERPVAIAG